MSDGSVIIETKLDDKEFQTQISKLDKVIDKGMKGALISIGAIATAITGIGASAIKFGTDYQQASNQLQASTGATSAEMENLKEVMKSVYANNFGEDMNDVANSIASVRKNLGELDNVSLQNATQSAIALRDTFEYDVNESTRSAKALMDNFGVSSEEAFNLITQGAQSGLDYSGELLDNISEYSVQFAKVGLDAEDMFNIFASGAENGAFNLDKIGDAVKEFSIRAIDGSNTTIDGFKRIGLNADTMAKKFASGGETAKQAFIEVVNRLGNMDDKVEQSKVGVDLFGTMWEDLGPEVVTQLGSIQGAFDQTKNSAEQLTQIKYDDLGSALQGIGRQLQTNLLLPISEKLLPVFNDLANKLSEALSSPEMQKSIDNIANSISGLVSGIANFVSSYLPQILNFVSWIIQNAPTILSILTGITVGIKAIQIGTKIADIVKGFSSLKNTITSVGGAFKALSSIVAVNPFVLIVGAIIGVVTALIVLWNTNEGFRNAVINTWNAICNFFRSIPGFFQGIWENVKNAFMTAWNSILIFFTETVPNAFSVFINFWIQLGESIKNIFLNAWNAIIAFFTETVPQWIQNIITWFQQLPYNIGIFIGQVFGHIANFGVNAWNWVTTELPQIIQGIIQWFAELPGNIWNWLVETANKIAEWGKNIWDTATTWVSNTINNIVNWFAELPGRIWSWLLNTINNVVTWGQEIWKKATTAISNTINDVVNWFAQLPGRIWSWLLTTVNNIVNWGTDIANKGKEAAQNLFDNIVNTVKEIPGKMLEIGKNIIEGLWNGITGMGSWIKDKISGFAGGIIDGFKKTFGIHSPSLVMNKEIGKYLALGLGQGFEDNIQKVYSKMKSAVDFETQKLSTNLTTQATLKANKDNVKTVNNDNGTVINNTQNFYETNPTPYEQQKQAKQQLRRLAYGL